MTNHSLVAGECQVTVHLAPDSYLNYWTQGAGHYGRIYAKAENLDLALIEVQEAMMPSVSWGNWQDLEVGDPVFAFGYTRGVEHLVEGAVQDPPASAPNGGGNATKTSLFWTDIETYPKFQGGPILDLQGEVLAITAAPPDTLDQSSAGKVSPSIPAQDLIDGIPRLGSRNPTLSTTPSSPVAGRPVSFTLETEPHRIARVTILDPGGREVPWIFPEGDTRTDDGQIITTRNLGADCHGKIEWDRDGFRDIPGDWTARVTLDPFADQPETGSLSYTLSDLELEDRGKIHFGIDLRRYEGPDFEVFYSDLVPAALAVDLQTELAGTAALLNDRLGVVTGEVPDLFLMGSRSHFDKVRGFMGVDQIGYDLAAYYAFPCPKCYQVKEPGIYVWVDTHDSETQILQTIAHEYAHALVNTIADERGDVLPIWVNEGFAGWSENSIGMESDEEQGVVQSWFDDADLVRSAAQAGSLLSLPSMESMQSWQSRTGDQVTLEYAEAYMAVRFLTETFGQSAIVDLITDFSRRGHLSLAMEEAAGISYGEFETRFKSWLGDE